MVPRLRTAGSPIIEASAASPGILACTSFEAATSACGVIAPMVMVAPSSVMPLRDPSFDRSTSATGLASRCFIVGISVMPPATSLLSSIEVSKLGRIRDLVGLVIGKWFHC